jgi:inorganic triphosphatase YgiF
LNSEVTAFRESRFLKGKLKLISAMSTEAWRHARDMAVMVHAFVTSALDVCVIITLREGAIKSQVYSGHGEEMKNQHPRLESSPDHLV